MDQDLDPDEAFPDVRSGARTALIVTVILAIIYGVTFSIMCSSTRAGTLDLWASLGLGGALLLLSYIDLRTGLLPDILTWPLVAFGLGYATHQGVLLVSLVGAVMGYALIAGIGLFWRRAKGYEGIGLGDAKLLAAGGAWVGAYGLPIVLLIASGAGLIAALIAAQRTRLSHEKAAIVFGPCLALGVWVVWCGLTLPVIEM
jgi:leader peptidase (prepilin peptidase)/N-methyltransferase